MNEILDAPEPQPISARNVEYAGVIPKIGAFIVDGVILSIASGAMSLSFSYSEYYYASLAVAALIAILYRPILERYLGATLGKLIFKIKVVQPDFSKVSYGKAFGRNIFHIGYNLVSLAFSYYILYQFTNATANSLFISGVNYRTFGNLILGAYLFLLFIDLMIMMNNIKGVSLHDRIAGTYVIRTRSLTHGPRAFAYEQPNGRASEILIAALVRNGINSLEAERNASLGLSMQIRHYAYMIVEQVKAGSTNFDNHYACIRELIGADNADIANALHLNLFLTLNEELGTNNLFEQQMPETVKHEYFKAVLSWEDKSEV